MAHMFALRPHKKYKDESKLESSSAIYIKKVLRQTAHSGTTDGKEATYQQHQLLKTRPKAYEPS